MAATNHSNVWSVGLVAVIAIGIAVAAVIQNFSGRAPNTDLTAFGTLLSTLLFASAILERALDVWLSLTMGGEADRLDAEIRSLKSKIESSPPDVKAAEEPKLAPLIAKRAAHQGGRDGSPRPWPSPQG